PKLSNCVSDAQGFLGVLTERYRFAPPGEGTTFTLYNEEATRPAIHAKLRELKKLIQPEDNLVIYFSGHGEIEDEVGYWVPVEARPENDWEFIGTSALKDRLNAINSFHTFLIVDACFSGSLFNTYRSVKAGYETKPSRLGLAASHSRERALDGTAGENSPFAGHLLKVLRESDQPLGVQKLATEVIEGVEAATRGKQTPVYKHLDVKGDDSGQYVFHLKGDQDETIAFETARKKDTLSAYTSFLRKFPHGNHAEEALSRVVELEDDLAWDEARKTGRLSDYLFYLRRHPEGRHVEEANEAIEKLSSPKEGSAQQTKPRVKETQPRKEEPSQASKKEEKGQFGSFTDPRDGQVYKTVKLGGLTWMAENLNFDVGEDCWFYDNDPENGEKYGRLYTWEAAKAACPPDWRLPTDYNWRGLAKQFGGIDKDTSDDGRTAYKALIESGRSGFAAQLGGWRSYDGSFRGFGENGYYWSDTIKDADIVWFYNFHRHHGKLYRYMGNKLFGNSCRCVKGGFLHPFGQVV
ncbi:MAG: FISUMP domain-containing protein, partial [Saprospiraceae bacterium]|nr:FISUMP domain-containing protein [Saprospiraceae bacterium]